MAKRGKYRVFHRTWWKRNKNWPDGKEPHAGKKHFVAWADTEAEARAICKRWNAAHDPGPLSDKAEYEEA